MFSDSPFLRKWLPTTSRTFSALMVCMHMHYCIRAFTSTFAVIIYSGYLYTSVNDSSICFLSKCCKHSLLVQVGVVYRGSMTPMPVCHSITDKKQKKVRRHMRMSQSSKSWHFHLCSLQGSGWWRYNVWRAIYHHTSWIANMYWYWQDNTATRIACPVPSTRQKKNTRRWTTFWRYW